MKTTSQHSRVIYQTKAKGVLYTYWYSFIILVLVYNDLSKLSALFPTFRFFLRVARCISLIRIDIPPSVTVIDDFAFSYCTALEEVVLHEGLQRIGGSAFIGCWSLIHSVIPHSVTAIGENAFNGCAVSILVGPHFRKHNYRILRGGSSNFKGHFLYSNKFRGLVPKTVTHVLIHYSVESLSRNSFYCYTALVEVVLHDGFRSIQDNAFSGCKSLVRIVIPASVTYIGSYAFSRCKGL